jgi:hypothetical protein
LHPPWAGLASTAHHLLHLLEFEFPQSHLFHLLSWYFQPKRFRPRAEVKSYRFFEGSS